MVAFGDRLVEGHLLAFHAEHLYRDFALCRKLYATSTLSQLELLQEDCDP